MVDHFLEIILKFIGKIIRMIGKEKIKEQITEFATETTLEVAEEKILPKHSGSDVKSNMNFQEFLKEMTQDGLVVLAGVSLMITIFGAACFLIRDLFEERFFFHWRNIVYIFELNLIFFSLFFVPSAVVGKSAAVFERLPSRKARGWSAFFVFVVLFCVTSWLAGKVFPNYSELLARVSK